MTENPQDQPAEGEQQRYSGQPSPESSADKYPSGPPPAAPYSDQPSSGQPDSGQPAPPPQAPAYQPVYGQAPVSPSDARMWALLANLSGFLFNIVGPLVIYLIYKDRDPFIRRHSAQALNFQIMIAIVAVVGSILTATLIFAIVGIPLLIAAGICWIIFPIMGAIAANRGEPYDYPLVPQMIT
jgi:uncharacterized Tic20 family protein